jgi:mannan endo-1,4-beta-mannosidase
MLRTLCGSFQEDFQVQPEDGVYNEEALKAMDMIIKEASEHGLRLIIPVANNWLTVDSKVRFANWTADSLGMMRPENPDDIFFTYPEAREKYRNHISRLLERYARVSFRTGT